MVRKRLSLKILVLVATNMVGVCLPQPRAVLEMCVLTHSETLDFVIEPNPLLALVSVNEGKGLLKVKCDSLSLTSLLARWQFYSGGRGLPYSHTLNGVMYVLSKIREHLTVYL